MKIPSIKFNPKIILVGTLGLVSIFVPQISSYLGAVSAIIEQQPEYNKNDPALEITPSWGCTHIRKVQSNAIN